MQSPFTDPTLSLRARGLFGLCLSVGRVPNESELTTAIPEGRDAIRKAKAELVNAGYLIKQTFRVKGKFRTEYYINQAWFTGDGFSGPLSIDNYVADSSSYSIYGITNVIPYIGAQAPREEKGEDMGWPGIDEPEAKHPRRKIEEDDIGSVGKIHDPEKNRAKKNRKTTTVKMFPEAKRLTMAEEDWGTPELVAEFYSLLRDKAPGVPDQVNGKSLATWINKRVGEGVTRLAILKGMRMFFTDPRNFHDVGIGRPVMERFMAYYRTVHGIVSRTEETVYMDEDTLAHQEKMLKLLGGQK